MKLLKSVYTATSDSQRKVDISVRLILRVLDEDDTVKVSSESIDTLSTLLIANTPTVKDLAIKSIEELWFPDPSVQPGKHHNDAHSLEAKQVMIDKVSVIMGVSESFRDRPQPLEDLLHQVSLALLHAETPIHSVNQIASDREDKQAASTTDPYAEICVTLIDSLVDAQDFPGFVRFTHHPTCRYMLISCLEYCQLC